MKVKLVAIRQLYGDYGKVLPGGVFEADEATALSLECRGLAERYCEPVQELPPFLANLADTPKQGTRKRTART